MRSQIITLVQNSLQDLYNLNKEVLVDIPKNNQADYSVNTPLQIAKELNQTPEEIAVSIINYFNNNDNIKTVFDSISLVKPGFIYFTVNKLQLIKIINSASLKWGSSQTKVDQNIMVEFATPNTHKAFHIGHLRNICLGESIVRLFNSQGAKTFRANYQGDIGPHTAKCVWALQKTLIPELSTPTDKADFIGKMYAQGSKAYEEDEQARKEIQAINKAIYEGKDSALMEIYTKSRQWSLDYLDYIYKRLGSYFDQLFFESATWQPGKKIVEANMGKVFQLSDNAVVFPGENYGLHTRVFISSEGNPTYEAKDLGLAPMQFSVFNFDTNIHIVANEQAEYFKVVFTAMDQIYPGMKNRQKHLSYGMVNLTTGKMSSRTGVVITTEWLIDEAKDKIMTIIADRDLTNEEKTDIAEIVGIGAIKFAMLHTMAKNDITFDLNKAVKIDGDSGPYVQYAHARICSILKKIDNQELEADFTLFNEQDWQLAKKIQYFPYQVSRATDEMSPHHLTHYLLQLVGDFSFWYNNNSVQNANTKELAQARIKLLKLLQITLKQGLYLLGIQAPEKM